MTQHKIGNIDELPDDSGMGIEIDGLELAIFKVDDEYHAVQNRCPHKSGPLYKGAIDAEDCTVHCPWHWIEFELETGKNVVTKESQLRVFETVIEGDELFVEL